MEWVYQSLRMHSLKVFPHLLQAPVAYLVILLHSLRVFPHLLQAPVAEAENEQLHHYYLWNCLLHDWTNTDV